MQWTRHFYHDLTKLKKKAYNGSGKSLSNYHNNKKNKKDIYSQNLVTPHGTAPLAFLGRLTSKQRSESYNQKKIAPKLQLQKTKRK